MAWRGVCAGLLSLSLLLLAAAEGEAAPLAAPDYCQTDDVPTPSTAEDTDGYVHALLDRTYAIPADFVPPDLASVAAAGFTGSRSAELVRRVVLPDLVALRQAATRAGHVLQVQSGYRSYATQSATFDYWVSISGYAEALRFSARPGHSEHQLGTAIDLTSGGTAPWNYADWAATPAGAWTAANAWQFGFVMSHPRSAEGITCYGYEPWHYRWVGVDVATRVRASGLTLRQFLQCCGGPHEESHELDVPAGTLSGATAVPQVSLAE
jgi:D-alanyl-D-alanine carboxypeptidase